MNAFDFEERLELLFSGFGRAYGLSFSIVVPRSLVCEMMKFYDRSFEWDAAKKSDAIILSNDKKLTEISSDSGWHAVVAANLVRADVHKTVHWEVKLRKLPNKEWGVVEIIRLMIGYVPEEARDSFDVNGPLGQKGDRALYLRTGAPFCAHPNRRCFRGYKFFHGDYCQE